MANRSNNFKLKLLYSIVCLVIVSALLICVEWDSTGILSGNLEHLFPNLQRLITDGTHKEEEGDPISGLDGKPVILSDDDSSVASVGSSVQFAPAESSSMGSIVPLAPVKSSNGLDFEGSATFTTTTTTTTRAVSADVPSPNLSKIPPLRCGSKALPKMRRSGGRVSYDSRETPDKLMIDYLEVAGGVGKGEGPRIFCGIYTYDKAHDKQARTVFDTWGKRCDKLVMFSNKEDASLNAIKVVVGMYGASENLIQKVRKMWLHIYQNYLNDFDYFYICGDDTYAIMDNLRAYLLQARFVAASALDLPLYLGRRFKLNGDPRRDFNTGGPGYVMNRGAMQMVGNEIANERCDPKTVGWHEDVVLANCLRDLGVLPLDTRDARGRDRFNPFRPVLHLTQDYEWLRTHTNGDWFLKYTYNFQAGFDCCAPNSISFHYVPEGLMRQMDMALYSAKETGCM